ncbi:MAG: nucleotidyltransferase family protein [Pedobacter sp.]
MDNTAIIILAGGNSSRLGRAKQLLPYKGTTLVRNIVDAALVAALVPTIVVTGASSEEVSKELDGMKVELVYNQNWKQGMGSGIVTGMNRLLAMVPLVENVIIAVCDQPFVTSDILINLHSLKNKSKKTIVSSAYADTVGTPVLFNKIHFRALLGLKGNTGAKNLIEEQKEDMISLPFERGSLDIDTEADYLKLIND